MTSADPPLTSPTEFPRRSPVYARLVAAGAAFEERHGAAIARTFGERSDERTAARRLGLADLSPLPRIGFKGRGAIPWLKSRNVAIEPSPNRAWRQADGGIAIARSGAETLILGDLRAESVLCSELEAATDAFEARAYAVPRYDGMFWFVLTGAQAAACLAKLCGVDLRPERFGDGSVAQTSVARTSAVVARVDLGADVAYHLLGDSASAEYLWDVLLDAMREFGGAPVGIAAVRALEDGIE